MKKKYEDMSTGEGLIAALEQAIDFEKDKKVEGVKTRKILVAPLPRYKGAKVRMIRNKLGFSRRIFSHIMGVSVKTVEAWESGRNEPQGPAQRVLMLLEKDDNFLEKYELIQSE